MIKIIDYNIFKSSSSEDLVRQVREKIRQGDGWIPNGEIVVVTEHITEGGVHHLKYIQVMVRVERMNVVPLQDIDPQMIMQTRKGVG